MDEEAVMEMVQHTAGYTIGAAVSAGIQLGDRLGVYRAMQGAGPLSADEVADSVGCNRRLIREWLDGQAAAGLISFDPRADEYELSPAAAMVLADDNSPVFLARGIQALGSLMIDMDRIVDTYQGDGGLGWSDHHQCLFDGVEWFFRTGYRAYLTAEWLPAMNGVSEKLTAGADVLDVGCGHGASVVTMAEAFRESRFVGIDYHEPSIDIARSRASEAGVGAQCGFLVGDAQSYQGDFDLICFFDCLHDMGDPVGAASHARKQLAEGGSVLLVEPFALSERAANIAENPFAAMTYHASSMICTPTSLSQDGRRGLGAQAGEEQLRAVMHEAGFASLELVAETPFNLILQAVL